VDCYSGQSYKHRRGWVEKRLLFLSTLFAIDICAYAVMSNHVHVVVHVDKNEASAWEVDEVLNRYHNLHKGTLLTQKYVRGDELNPSERITFDETVEEYRLRQ
jgi:tRNA(Arg) A34 adenosine deaminase TadA